MIDVECLVGRPGRSPSARRRRPSARRSEQLAHVDLDGRERLGRDGFAGCSPLHDDVARGGPVVEQQDAFFGCRMQSCRTLAACRAGPLHARDASLRRRGWNRRAARGSTPSPDSADHAWHGRGRTRGAAEARERVQRDVPSRLGPAGGGHAKSARGPGVCAESAHRAAGQRGQTPWPAGGIAGAWRQAG